MPKATSRLLLAPLAASFLMSVAGCGSKSDGNSTQAHLSDLEKADGTINDGMTDLDGVQTETPAVALTNTAPAPAASNTEEPQARNAASPAQEEVVADQ